jgi:hypothetical protein
LEIEYIIGYIVIPAGFIFDGASIPKSLRPIIGSEVDDRFLIAGLVHDWVYDKRCMLPLSREECDVLFLVLLLEYGTDPTLAHMMYWAVNLFGNQFYRR